MCRMTFKSCINDEILAGALVTERGLNSYELVNAAASIYEKQKAIRLKNTKEKS